MKYKTIIIAGFPGSGKTYLTEKLIKEKSDISILDVPSASYKSRITDNCAKVQANNFPENYIEYIKSKIGKYEIILIDSDRAILMGLKYNNIKYQLVLPDINMGFSKYVSRYPKQKSGTVLKFGSRHLFYVRYLVHNWDQEIAVESIMSTAENQFRLTSDTPYLSSIIDKIIN
jgi:GTPase SAR1 family protein